jgi:Spy/CpxP family protein refolding chaperone
MESFSMKSGIIKILVMVLLAGWAILPAAGFAQETERSEENSLQNVFQLNLSPEQEKKLEKIMLEQQEKMRNVRRNSSLARQEREQLAAEVREEQFKKINEILTSEQRKKLAELKKQKKTRTGQRR